MDHAKGNVASKITSLMYDVVSRILRHLPGPSGAGQHENDLLPGSITFRLQSSAICVLDVEVTNNSYISASYFTALRITIRTAFLEPWACTFSPSVPKRLVKGFPRLCTLFYPVSTPRQWAS